MHFAPIALILPLFLSLVMAGSTSGESTASEVVTPQYLASGAADHAKEVANEATSASVHLTTFTKSYDAWTFLPTNSANNLDYARLQLTHAANLTRETQRRLNHTPVTAVYPQVIQAANHASDDPKPPKAHSTISLHHAIEAVKLAEEAHTHLKTFAKSPSLSEKDGANLEHPKQLLDAADQHLVHAIRHSHKARYAAEVLKHNRGREDDPLYHDTGLTGAEITISHPLAVEFHDAWAKRHRDVAGQLMLGPGEPFVVPGRRPIRPAEPRADDPQESALRATGYRNRIKANLDLAKHHEGKALEAEAYQKKKREEKEKKGAEGSSSKGKAKA